MVSHLWCILGFANFIITAVNCCCRYWHWKVENQLNPSTSTKKQKDQAATGVRTAQTSSWTSQGHHQLLTVPYPLIITISSNNNRTQAAEPPSFQLPLLPLDQHQQEEELLLSFSKPIFQGQITFSAKRLIIILSKKRA